MKYVFRLSLLLVLVLVPFAGELMAQPIGGPPPCWPPPCIPIDGGLGALIAAGTLLGVRKAIALKRSSKHQP